MGQTVDFSEAIKEPKIESFRQIKEILEPVPADKFQKSAFGHVPPKEQRGIFGCPGRNIGEADNGCSCALGFIHRHFDPSDGTARGDRNGFGARELSKKFFKELPGYYQYYDISDVNNGTDPVRKLYPQQGIKERIMAFVEDGIKWEENKA